MSVFTDKSSWAYRNIGDNPLLNPYASFMWFKQGGRRAQDIAREDELKAQALKQQVIADAYAETLKANISGVENAEKSAQTSSNVITYGIGGLVLVGTVIIGAMYLRKRKK